MDGGLEPRAQGLDLDLFPAELLRQNRGDAARGVAAGLDLGAVGVADAHACVGALFGRLQDDELIAANAALAIGDRRGQAVVEREGLGAGIDNDEVVTESMHLGEGAGHGNSGRFEG